jgi:hypothetical protein
MVVKYLEYDGMAVVRMVTKHIPDNASASFDFQALIFQSRTWGEM